MNFFIKFIFVIVICTPFYGICAFNYKTLNTRNADQDAQVSIDTNIVQRIDARFRSEVINPFQSCVDEYDKIIKKVEELVNITKTIENDVLSAAFDQKYREMFATFFEKLQQTSTSSIVLGKYISEVQILTNNDISVAKKQIDLKKASLEAKQSVLVKLNDNLLKLNKGIKSDEDNLKKQQSNLKELMAKAVKPAWWCLLVGPFSPACLALQGLKQVNELKNSITKLETSISSVRNKISATEHTRFGVLSQISDIETEIKNLNEGLTLLQKLTQALKVRLEVTVKVQEKITTVMKYTGGKEDTAQKHVPEPQKLQLGFNLASEDFLQLMHDIGGYLKKIEGGTKTSLDPTVSKEQIMKIFEMFTKIPKPDVVA